MSTTKTASVPLWTQWYEPREFVVRNSRAGPLGFAVKPGRVYDLVQEERKTDSDLARAKGLGTWTDYTPGDVMLLTTITFNDNLRLSREHSGYLGFKLHYLGGLTAYIEGSEVYTVSTK